jgi:colicin import membrane protein
MRHALNIGKEPKFHVIVVTSAVIHLLLITFIVVPLKTRTREYSSYFVNLVGPVETPAGIKSNQGPANVPTTLTDKAELKEFTKPLSKDEMSLETDKQISKEIERIRALSAISKQKKKKEEAKGHDIEVGRQKILGSVSRSSGIPSALQSKGTDSYYALVTRKIWSEWIYPESDLSGLEVVITIKIDSEGKVISQEIEKSSGNILFDRSAVKAISKASPLPPPPVEMEIGVRFYL